MKRSSTRSAETMALALVGLLAAAAAAPAAAPDGNVEWGGVSHMPWLDRAPRCPVDGQSFSVSFQAYANDLTSARVRVDGEVGAWIDAAVGSARGPYDVWTAQLPATGGTQISYYVELRDGGDVDYKLEVDYTI